MDDGIKYCSNETCLPVKVFHGHVFNLKDIVDYIFIPRYTSLDKNEYTCPKFCGLPDMILLNLKKRVKILEIRIHQDLFPSVTYESLADISEILKIKYGQVLKAFEDAVMLYHKHMRGICCDSRYVPGVTDTEKVLSVLGHPYMVYDNYLSMNLIKKLEKRNLTVVTSRDIDHETKRRNAYPFQGKVFWHIGFELLGSAFTFAQDKNIKGLIYLTPFACGVDAFVIEFIERRIKDRYSVPFLKLMIDEHTGEAGFDTRLEAFLDTVG